MHRPSVLVLAPALWIAGVALLVPSSRAQGGEWQAHASMALARQEVGAARIGDSVYVVGGLTAGPGIHATDTVEVYDVAAGTWSGAPPMPAARDHMGVAAAGGKLYVIGGYAGNFLAQTSVFVFDPVANAWSPGPSLPSARGGCWAVEHGGRIYLFGGTDTTGAARASTFEFDPATNAWTPRADMPTAREHLTAAALGAFVHVVGGRDGAAFDAHERYDPVLNTWLPRAPLPTARSATATTAFAGKLFVMGGEVPQLFAVNEVYDPVLNAWSTQAPMPIPRHGIAAVALDDRILMPGGGIVQGLLPTNAVDAFLPAANGTEHLCFCGAGAPCGNPDADAGCRNSTGQGAFLTTTGSASVAADTLRLVGSSMPATASALYLQATVLENGGAGTAILDGLRCTGGTVVRLGVRTNVNGASAFPAPGGVSIAVRGGATPGSVRVYQAWYRNPAGPCGGGANWTSAVRLTWGP